MRLFIQAVSTVSRALGFLSALLLASAVLSVAHMVYVRYVLGQSTVWQTEYTIYSVVAATFLGSAWVLILRGHVNVDLLPMAAGRSLRSVLQLLSSLASLLFIGLMGYSACYYFYEAWTLGWTTSSVWALPLWIPTLPVAVGLVWLFIQYIADLCVLWLDGPDEKSTTARETAEVAEGA